MVRAAVVSDSARIGRIHVDGWRAAYRGIIPDSFLADLSAEKRADGWKHAIEQDRRGVFVFERDRVVVGFASIGKSRDPIEGAGELFALYVDPTC